MALLPLFPLSTVVLFPDALLPLHIFEPRYRAMVADALEDDRRIAMVLLRPGWENDYEGRPAIYPIGCSGVIVHSAKLDDGRFNIVLRGFERVRIVAEDHERPYRRATFEAVPDSPSGDDGREAIAELRAQLGEADHLSAMPDANFVHTLAQSLDLEPIEQQALLECPSLGVRAQALVEFLEMKRLRESLPSGGVVPH